MKAGIIAFCILAVIIKWRRFGNMCRSAFQMGTLVRNCLSGTVASCPNLRTNGQKDKRKGAVEICTTYPELAYNLIYVADGKLERHTMFVL